MVGVGMDSNNPTGNWLAALLAAWLLGGSLVHGQTRPEMPPEYRQTSPVAPLAYRSSSSAASGAEQVVDVRVVGNGQIPLKRILPHIKTRMNRPLNPRVIEEDVRRLTKTGMFVSVKPFLQRVDGGRIVIFEVIERPKLNYVKYVGNKKLSKKTLAKEAQIKAGEALDLFEVEQARQRIEEFYQSKGFAKASVSIFEGNKPSDRGVIFLINEGPKQRVLWTNFVGNRITTDARLRTQIRSKHGFLWLFKGEVDEKQIEEDEDRLVAYYRSLGFFRARVGSEKRFDASQDWLRLTFVIDEGPRYKVRNLSVVGNKRFSTEELLGELELRAGEFFNQAEMNSDVATIQEHYGGVGCIFADVKADPRFLEQPGLIDLVYDISEGERYRVGRINVAIEGDNPHTRITTVLNRMSVKPGDVVDIRELRASERRLRSCELFRVDPSKGVVPKIAFSPPDLEDVEEAESAVARQPKRRPGFRGQSPDPTPHAVYRRPPPGNPRQRDRVINLNVQGQWIDSPQPDTPPEADQPLPPPPSGGSGPMIIRGQNPDWQTGQERNSWSPPRPNEPQAGYANRGDWAQRQQRAGWAGSSEASPRKSSPWGPAVRDPSHPGGVFQQAAGTRSETRTLDRAESALRQAMSPEQREPIIRFQFAAEGGTSVPSLPSSQPWLVQPSGSGSSSTWSEGSYPSPGDGGGGSGNWQLENAQAPPSMSSSSENSFLPLSQLPPPNDLGSNTVYPDTGILGDPSPLWGNPPSGDPPRYIPLIPTLQETETGRLMFSVGVNSDAGLLGSVIVDEQNFDWRRWPRSWADIRDGTAWRGAGQRFRLEAVPGTQLHNYTATFQEPYLLDTQVSLGLNGYFYSRYYREWDEQRLGGRVALGYRLTHDLSTSVAFRGAKIGIYDPILGAPPELLEVIGDSALYGFRAQLAHDTRDSPILATEGHLFQIGFEQVIGSFDYARADVDLRKYFMLRQRPDGSGRHVMSLKTALAITGDNTPIYEHYYAGGYSTIRGFDFRGASARNNGVVVGGHLSLLASIEYMFPITADDTLRGVVFCDTGAVQPSIDDWTDKYRVSPGFGLRITIAAMGPAPIALDFAFPAVNEPGDEVENFSFFIGFLR